MFTGRILAIQITPIKAGPTQSVQSAEVQPGCGLAGNHYSADSAGLKRLTPGQEVTLIESEAIVAAVRDHGLSVTHAETRRNLLTEGVPLNHLVGEKFRVGEVELRGIELCEPCRHLEKLTRTGMIKAFRHRGGLRAQVISGGTLRVGDVVQLANRQIPVGGGPLF